MFADEFWLLLWFVVVPVPDVVVAVVVVVGAVAVIPIKLAGVEFRPQTGDLSRFKTSMNSSRIWLLREIRRRKT